MSDKDNVVRVDFRRRAVVDEAGEVQSELPPVAPPEPQVPATKLERFSGMLEHGMVQVTFDTRVKGVSVPEQFRGTPQLHLNFSLRFRVEDFDYDEAGIRGSLSFDSGEYFCVIPWPAVYGLWSKSLTERVTYRESFPPELLAVLPALAGLDDALHGRDADGVDADADADDVDSDTGDGSEEE